MKRIDNYTPRQLAHDLALGWLRRVHEGSTGDLADLTEAQRREVRKHLARLHDDLLSASGMDGLPLGN